MICPKCQYENTDDARFCRFCGAPLQEGVAEEGLALPSEPGLCPNCGHQNEASAQYCASCGAAIEDSHRRHLPEYLTPAGQKPPPFPKGGFTDIVGMTFSIYAEHFVPFFLIALVPQAISLVAADLLIAPLAADFAPLAEDLAEDFTLDVGRMLLMLAMIFVTQIVVNFFATGATIHAVGRHFLGLPIQVTRSYRVAMSKLVKLIAVALILVAVLIPLILLSFVLIGIPILILIVIAWLFVTQAIIVEDAEPVAALRRSWDIVVTNKNWWSTFGYAAGLFLMVIGIYIVGGRVLSIPASIHPAVAWPIAILFGTLVAPVVEIGLTALYFKLRTQTESYDHRRLAEELSP